VRYPQDILEWEKVEGPATCERLAGHTDDLYIHHYAVREDGSSFGTLVDGSEPYGPFSLAANGLWNVAGLAESVEGMCLGDRRRVVVPPRLSWPGIHDTIQVRSGFYFYVLQWCKINIITKFFAKSKNFI
jgi:hypothetical protein